MIRAVGKSLYSSWKNGEPKKGIPPGVPWYVVGPLLLERPDIKELLERSSQTEPPRAISDSGGEDDLHKVEVARQAVNRYWNDRATNPKWAEIWQVIERPEASTSGESDSAKPDKIDLLAIEMTKLVIAVNKFADAFNQSVLGQRFRRRGGSVTDLQSGTEGSSA